jgi:hypothetical protein
MILNVDSIDEKECFTVGELVYLTSPRAITYSRTQSIKDCFRKRICGIKPTSEISE